MILRLAAGLARTREEGHRWRRLAVPAAAAASMLLLLMAGSLLALAYREHARAQERSATVAASRAASDLLWLERGDDHRGREFAVVWLEAAGESAPELPPGLLRLPAPGGAAVSPALEKLIRREPILARRYPKRVVLGSDGIRSGGELLAYVTPARGHSIRRHPSTLRLSGFGPSQTGIRISLNIDSAVAPGPLAGGALAFLVVPAVLLLLAGAATSSSARQHRFSILRAIGARERTIAALATAECTLMALPGIVAAILGWGLVAGRLQSVPGVAHTTVAGDLGLPLWALAATGLLGVVLSAALALAIFARPRSMRASGRPGRGRQSTTAWRVVPLGLAIGLAFGAASVGGRVGATGMLVAVVGALAALPLAGARLLPAVGAQLARSRSTAGMLAGRRLQWEPVRHGRPFALAGALVLLGVMTGCYVAILRDVEVGRVPAGSTSAALIRWTDPAPTDVARLGRELGRGAVVPARETPRGLILHTSCSDLARRVSLRCDGTAARDEIARLLGFTGPEGVTFAAPPRAAEASSAIVLARAPMQLLDGEVRTAAARTLTAPTVSSAAGRLRRASVLDAWLEAGLAIAGLALALGALALVIDGSLQARRPNEVLARLGMSTRAVARLEASLFCIPYAALTALGAGVGLTFALLFKQVAGAGIPTSWVAGIGATTLAFGLAGAAAIVILTIRSAQPAR